MSKIQNVRGTKDIFFQELLKFEKIENTAKQVAFNYSFEEIRTPIFEFKSLFEKNIGETTDVVNKEMYVFQGKKDNDIVLRPEGTAPVIRSIISNGLTHFLPLKLFYLGAMFRYERPQKGRQRQFHQVGFEYIGSNSYIADIEIINAALSFLNNLGIKNLKLLINTLGSSDTLNKYKLELRKYLEEHKNELSEYSKIRLDKNPLRTLDSKEKQDLPIVANAPKITQYLSKEDKMHFENITKYLDNVGINYEIDDTLVRGLDYYNHTVFEFVSDQLGSQSTVLAGGRYNSMLKDMGGPDVGCVGFAAGIERLSLLLDLEEQVPNKIAVITQDESYLHMGLALASTVRKNNIACDYILGKNMTNKLKKIDNKYLLAFILGEREFQGNFVTVKHLHTKDIENKQQEVDSTRIIGFLKDNYPHLINNLIRL